MVYDIFLSCCHVLEECHVAIWPTDAVQASSESPIFFPKLRILTIEGEDSSENSILHLIDTPSVQVLRLYPLARPVDAHLWDVFEPPPFKISSFLSRCQVLESLTINSRPLKSSDFQDVLEYVPRIKHLFLDHSYTPDHHTSADYTHYDPYSTGRIRPQPSSVENISPLLNQPTHDASTSDAASHSTSPHLVVYQPILPNLTSFTAVISLNNDEGEKQSDLLSFLKARIQPLTPNNSEIGTLEESARCASLKNIKLVLEGRPVAALSIYSSVEPQQFDVADELQRHAEAVGRKPGVDIFLDISYPWEDNEEMSIMHPNTEGLDQETDFTWPYFDIE
ncbi:hypothetical protein CVT24_011495 [Panaeolus cyanescens]|uniref:Uncharacterized protein n=1 Tax=Panaeolus cyanescens TaxID=181874 RepID=A0A409YGZ8_9AGAR|nr:hypothetical protein CVT24_011495 [Panaeolus cyanescens]